MSNKVLNLATNRYNSFEVPLYKTTVDVNGKSTKSSYDAYADGYRYADFQLYNEDTETTYEFDDFDITSLNPNKAVIIVTKALAVFPAGDNYQFQVTIKKAADAQPLLVVDGTAVVVDVLVEY